VYPSLAALKEAASSSMCTGVTNNLKSGFTQLVNNTRT